MKRNWEYKKLGEVCDPLTGLWTGKKEPFVNVAVIRNTNFSKDCKLKLDDVAYLDVEQKQYSTRKLLPGDIIVEKSGGSDKQPVGRVVLFDIPKGEFSFSNFTGTLRIKNKRELNSRFLHRCLFAHYLRGETRKLQSKTTGLHNLDMKGYLKLPIPVPPLEEQSRIVAELDLLTGIIDKQNAQLKELDNLAQSIFYDMFGDPIENPKGWEVKKLGDACLSITDGDHMPPPKVDQGIPFLTISDIDKETRILNFENTFHVPEEYFISLKDDRKAQVGDLLYTVTGSYGIPVIITEKRDFCFQRHIALLKPKKDALNTYFLCYWVLCKSVKLMADGVATGIAQKTVGLGSIRKFDIILPPLAIQQSFAEKIQSIEKQKETIRASIADTQKLLDYTMDKYFG